jgi:Flp pilus assembly protein TadD
MKSLSKLLIVTVFTLLSHGLVMPASANMGEDDSAGSSNPLWTEGKKAVESQDWPKAIEILSKLVQAEPNNADAHNFLGYAYRKKGIFEASFNHYNEALKLNPRHRHAHEYIGEAYLLTDNLAKAEQHLAELRKICTPIPCEEYRELSRAVDAYKKAKK